METRALSCWEMRSTPLVELRIFNDIDVDDCPVFVFVWKKARQVLQAPQTELHLVETRPPQHTASLSLFELLTALAARVYLLTDRDA
jgi:hypothetical protein